MLPYAAEVEKLQVKKYPNYSSYNNTVDFEKLQYKKPTVNPDDFISKTYHYEENDYTELPDFITQAELTAYKKPTKAFNIHDHVYKNPEFYENIYDTLSNNRSGFNNGTFLDKQIAKLSHTLREYDTKYDKNIAKFAENYRSGFLEEITGKDSAATKKAKEDTKQAQSYYAFLTASSADARQIAAAKAAADVSMAQSRALMYRDQMDTLKAQSADQAKIKEAEFRMNEALADIEREKAKESEITARNESDNKVRAEEIRARADIDIANATTELEKERIREIAKSEQLKLMQVGESERDKLSNTMVVNLAQTAAQKDVAQAELDARLREAIAQKELEERLRVSDNNTKVEMLRINADVQKSISADEKNAMVQKEMLSSINSVAKASAEGITKAIKMVLPNGVDGILGETNKIVTNINDQNSRLLMEQARQSTIQQQLATEQNSRQLNALLEAQRQERIINLQRAEEDSLRAQRMIQELQKQMKNNSELATKKPSEILSSLVSNVVVENIMKCQSSVKMNQTIGGTTGKIVIGGKNNKLDVTQKQVVSFSAECGQDVNSIIEMQQKITDTVKDFIALQSKSTILGMDKLPATYGSSVKTEVQNLFNSKTITEILADFEASQLVSNIEITGEGNQATFNQDQTLNILLKSVQKVTNKMEIMTDLQKNVDKQAEVEVTITEDYFTPTNIFIVLMFILLVLFGLIYSKKGKNTYSTNTTPLA